MDGQFSQGLVKVSHSLLLAAGGHATCSGAILRAPGGFAVEMRDGCNAINVTILLWSAVLAFPAPWKMKALGLTAGTLCHSVRGRFIAASRTAWRNLTAGSYR